MPEGASPRDNGSWRRPRRRTKMSFDEIQRDRTNIGAVHKRVSANRPSRVLFASLIGTAIEFFDFYNLAGIFGASLAPYIATWLAQRHGLQFVGYYLSAAAILSLVGLVAMRETKDEELSP